MRLGRLRAGVAEIEYKPPLGLMMADGAPVAKGYLTPLYVRALVLSNGLDEVGIVTLDLIGMDRADVAEAARRAHERCGIPPEAIMWSARTRTWRHPLPPVLHPTVRPSTPTSRPRRSSASVLSWI